jgi:hypothetical protein
MVKSLPLLASLLTTTVCRLLSPSSAVPRDRCCTADGAGALANCRIFPAIIIPNGGANTAHATVASAPAGAVTWRGTASTAYKPRFIIQKQAIVCNTADLIMPATGTARRQSLTQVPLSIRMWQDSTFATGDHQVRLTLPSRLTSATVGVSFALTVRN